MEQAVSAREKGATEIIQTSTSVRTCPPCPLWVKRWQFQGVVGEPNVN